MNKLKSYRVGQNLIGFLWFGLGLAIFSLFFSLIKAYPSIYTSLKIINMFQTIFEGIVILITTVIFLVWMHRLHFDLVNLFSGYPITPGRAIAQLMIPFYNLWGIWNIFATLANRLESEGGDLTIWGSSLRSWLPGLYIVGFASGVLGHVTTGELFNSIVRGEFSVLLLLDATVGLFLSIIWLQMARIIWKAVEYKAK